MAGETQVPIAGVGQRLRVKVLTPYRAVFDDEAQYVVLPAYDGEWGILPGHAPLVTALAAGCLRITRPDGNGVAFAVRGGFAQVSGNAVNVLTPECLGPGELTLELVEQETGKLQKGAGLPAEQASQARQHAWAKACRVARERNHGTAAGQKH